MHVKYRYSYTILMKICQQFFEKLVTNFTKIRSVGAELFYVDGQT